MYSLFVLAPVGCVLCVTLLFCGVGIAVNGRIQRRGAGVRTPTPEKSENIGILAIPVRIP